MSTRPSHESCSLFPPPCSRAHLASSSHVSSEMSPMEKTVFIVAKTTLGSKEMRTALFFYVLAMHLLVFVTTYHWSHSSTCESLHQHQALAHFHGGVPLPETPNGVAFAQAAAQAAAGSTP